MSGYLDIFSRSPFSPLQRHMTDVISCVRLLTPFFSAILDGDIKSAEQLQEQIRDLERHADKQQHSAMHRMPRGVFMPVSRQDLLELLSLQAEVAYKVDDIAGRLCSRPVKLAQHLPASLATALLEYVDQIQQLAGFAQKAVNELDELLSTGFVGREVDQVTAMLDKLSDCEVTARQRLRQLRGAISDSEESLPVIEVVYMFRISDRLTELQHLLKRFSYQFSLLIAKS